MIDIIVNPVAGDRTGKKVIEKMRTICRRLEERKVEYTLHRIDEKQRTRQYTASLIEKGATTIVAMGGDGTIHEVLNGITDFDKISLGIIPCGTGNDFAKNLGIPCDLEKAVDVLVDKKPKPMDFLQFADGLRGMNIAGVGIDVDVVNRYHHLKKKSKFGYTWCLVKALLCYKPYTFTAEFNGKRTKINAMMACIANGSYFGGGIEISPNSKAGDAKLEFLYVESMPKYKIPPSFVKLKKGNVLKLPQTKVEPANEVKITSENPINVQIDGEIYENFNFDVKIVSNKLKLIY